MKRLLRYLTALLLAVALTAAVWALIKSRKEARRLSENYSALAQLSGELCDSLESSRLSIARLRMTLGELEEYRADAAAEIERLGVRLRRAESLTKVVSAVEVDTTLHHTPSVTVDSTLHHTFTPILSDSLFVLGWRDGWVQLDVTSRPSESHISFTSCDTLFQVVHRVPYRWWIFSWGTKALRQEIRSSNPHTRLVYAEYIQIEN